MAKRWVIGRIWAVLMSAGMLTCVQNAAAEQPTKPGKIIIGDVIITGNQRMTTEQIKAHLHTRPGKEYNPAVVDDDVRELYKTGQFSNIITHLQSDGADRAKIYFGVREMYGVVQKVTFLGAKHIKLDELQNITGVRAGMLLDPNLNSQGCRKTRDKYAELGRPFSDCQLIKGGNPADTEVIYQITEGPKVKVSNIQFTGNTFVSSARLMTQLKSSSGWFHLPGSPYNKEKAEADVAELEKYFCSFGYQDVNVSLETQRSADGRKVTLIFHIRQGKRYRVRDVPEVRGAQEISRQQLIALSCFKAGDYLDRRKINTDFKIITDYMRQHG